MVQLAGFAARKALMDTLRHECGHLITAKVLGFVTGDIELKANSACAGIDLPLSIESLDDVKQFLGKRVSVLYAGSIAQSLSPKGIANAQDTDKFLRSTATDDFSKIRELVRLFVGIQNAGVTDNEFAKKLRAAEVRFSTQASKIVEKYAEAIVDLALYFLKEYQAAGQPQKFKLLREQIDASEPIKSLGLT
jgi:hypothetical protein